MIGVNSNNSSTFRILDAAANRAQEGLRVVEDYLRFVLEDAHLTRQTKQLRHRLHQTCAALPWPERLAARDTPGDVGTSISTASERSRENAREVCLASLARVKQSLRSLEEFGKVAAVELADEFQRLRYSLYTLERAVGVTQHSLQRLEKVQLYVLIDAAISEAKFRPLVGQLVAGGVGMVQLRDKTLDDRQLIDRARLLIEEVRSSAGGTLPLVIINDRPDVAAIAGADGVHLGQEDMAVADARRIVGPQALVGASTHSIEQARAAVLEGANYIGAGPTFPSTTKSFDQFPGVDFLTQVAAEIRLPTFAIGGITPENLDEVLATGITRVAVSGALANASAPQKTAASISEQLKASLRNQRP